MCNFRFQVFPYEHFQSIEEIRQCRVFPAIAAFSTQLKGDCDESNYTSCKAEFDRRMSLPNGHPEKWQSFEDYLRHYNGKCKFRLQIFKFDQV